jgi:hypothetical protein
LHRHQGLCQFLVQPLEFISTQFHRLEDDDQSLEGSGEAEGHFIFVFLQYWSSGVLSDVECFIEREARRYGARDAALCDLPFIHQQRRSRGLANTAAVILEFDTLVGQIVCLAVILVDIVKLPFEIMGLGS